LFIPALLSNRRRECDSKRRRWQSRQQFDEPIGSDVVLAARAASEHKSELLRDHMMANARDWASGEDG
jgi:hypothetical protein